ncbi:amiloride-sensitive sodium channel subunit beta-like [Haliotis asinina]|uniref:amiloride-sensitive sodium channel subunit beta-like n=1 Tax=Haliotis asinina TaxID=109174 RepID=UPI0035323708
MESLGPKSAWSEKTDSTRQTIESLWSDFTQDTGLHGLNKLSPGRRHKVSCVLWAVLVFTMAAFMCYSITTELINFSRYPVNTNTKVDVLEEIEFPAVTFCSHSPYNLSKVKATDPNLHQFFNKISILGSLMSQVNWSEPEYNVPTFQESHSLEWWKELGMSPDEMFYMCLMDEVIHYPCMKVMKPVLTQTGNCATFNWNTSDVAKVRVTGSDNNLIMYAQIDQANYVLGSQLAAGIKVILHDPRVHPDEAKSSFLAAPGTSTYAAVHKSRYKYLPSPYEAFQNRTCLDTLTTEFKNPLIYFEIYTYENCQRECLTRTAYKICGCIRPTDNGTIGRLCSLYELNVCFSPTYLHLKKNATLQKSCGCQMPCSFETYDIKVSTSAYPSDAAMDYLVKHSTFTEEDYITKNLLEIRVFFENLIMHSTEQTPKYTTQTTLGNLGGQMGIYLGASFLTVTELGEFLFRLCVAAIRRCKRSDKVINVSYDQA